jgi:8-oxo-dGTP pyrophosphatase MutT (NUDIX family)
VPTPAPLTPTQRVAAYGVLPDAGGRVVLVAQSAGSDVEGTWFLPGGGVEFGEHPADAVVRETLEETGVAVRVAGVRAVVADVHALPHHGELKHTLRVLYDLLPLDPGFSVGLHREDGGTSGEVRLATLAEAGALPLMPFVAATLGLPVPPMPVARPPRRPVAPPDAGPVRPAGSGVPVAEGAPVAEGGAPASDVDAAALHAGPLTRVQRPAAYALCHTTGPEGLLLLLSRLRDSTLWTLPGGGIDHGEDAVAAAVREVHEETGLPVELRGLLDVDSIRFTGRGPSGQAEDFHGIRFVYDGVVPADVAPRVVEVGGSTVEAAWHPVADLGRLQLTGLVRAALAHLP